MLLRTLLDIQKDVKLMSLQRMKLLHFRQMGPQKDQIYNPANPKHFSENGFYILVAFSEITWELTIDIYLEMSFSKYLLKCLMF